MNDMEYKNVVWDWNGTLLDDVKISVDTINVMLERKHLGKLTVEEYRSIFGFPVKRSGLISRRMTGRPCRGIS